MAVSGAAHARHGQGAELTLVDGLLLAAERSLLNLDLVKLLLLLLASNWPKCLTAATVGVASRYSNVGGLEPSSAPALDASRPASIDSSGPSSWRGPGYLKPG